MTMRVLALGLCAASAAAAAGPKLLPNVTICHKLCPQCEHFKGDNPADCPCDACWPGSAVNTTSDTSCTCFAKLGMCKAGEAPKVRARSAWTRGLSGSAAAACRRPHLDLMVAGSACCRLIIVGGDVVGSIHPARSARVAGRRRTTRAIVSRRSASASRRRRCQLIRAATRTTILATTRPSALGASRRSARARPGPAGPAPASPTPRTTPVTASLSSACARPARSPSTRPARSVRAAGRRAITLVTASPPSASATRPRLERSLHKRYLHCLMRLTLPRYRHICTVS